ncbi:hypothetical protein JFV30_14410 [Pseudomonas sp. TH32]|uniref:hypothetical protein n=1 Tax=Pseudomonas sp. TH32 TaxID=2796397 RepID=UPI001912546B|nr:hypothetical protein [Pseudomonas sp. TH32]MBK5437970.1 hypothetical protein [Pseudomonas sp. TH32]
MKDMKWTEHLSVVSSVASITGVSLVWLDKSTKDTTFMTVLFGGMSSVVGALVSIGVLVVVVQLFAMGHRVLRSKWPSAVPAYWLLAGAAIIWLVFWAQFIIWFMVKEAWATRFSALG